MRKFIISAVFTLLVTGAYAQIGEYRNNMSIGVNGGYVLVAKNVIIRTAALERAYKSRTGGISMEKLTVE